MAEATHRDVETNGIRLHVVEQGAGPVVLLCHGFPESWYSWRHQLPALAAAGFRAIAPDMRGYGRSDRPAAIEAYTQLHHVGDMIGVLDALETETAVIVGHDWGAPVAWHAALMRPDRIRAVAALSVPYAPRGAVAPTVALREAAGDRFMYMLYFQTPGVAEAELEADVPKTLRRLMYGASGDAPPVRGLWGAGMAKDARLLDAMPDPDPLPAWLTAADLEFYAGEFRRTGFAGGLNWYRTLDLTWELMAAYHGAPIRQPALFVAGDRDGVITRMRARYDRLEGAVPNLRRKVLLPGCGHWTQQERPAEVNAELIAFLRALP